MPDDTFVWKITAIDGEPHEVRVTPGRPVFVLGANGTGKSALLVQLMRDASFADKRKISAHRQGWFQGSRLAHAPQQIEAFKSSATGFHQTPQSRYSEQHLGSESSTLIHSLFDAEARRNARVAARVDAGDPSGATDVAQADRSPLGAVNEILANATLTAQLELSEKSELLARHGSGPPFGVAELSDGERNAISLAIQTMTAPGNALLIIDEPERHLHPSIARPLIAALFHRREDCAFVIASHDTSLPLARQSSSVVLLRNCTWEANGTRNAWDADVVDANSDLPEELLSKIYGSRRDILFVEGTPSSLDLPLYAGLFPQLSVEPVESCDRVIQCVKGIRASYGKHRLRAFGLIDRDDRSDTDVAELAGEGIYALDAYSVEALYYCSESRVAVAQRIAATFPSTSPQEVCDEAVTRALAALESDANKSRMPARRAERTMRARILTQLPDWRALEGNQDGQRIQCTAESPFAEERRLYQSLLDANDLDGLIRRYPVRESQVLAAIASAICGQDRARYEDAVLSCIRSTDDLADQLRKVLGGLTAELAQSDASR